MKPIVIKPGDLVRHGTEMAESKMVFRVEEIIVTRPDMEVTGPQCDMRIFEPAPDEDAELTIVCVNARKSKIS